MRRKTNEDLRVCASFGDRIYNKFCVMLLWCLEVRDNSQMIQWFTQIGTYN